MKKIIIVLATLALIGAGCNFGQKTSSFAGTVYQNKDYSFSFNYPENIDIHNRGEKIKDYQYLNMDVDFFASIRDIDREEKPVNLAFLFAAPKMSVEDFVQKLKDTGVEKINDPEKIKINNLTFYKITNNTALGEDKVHYLFDRGEKTIIISIFMGETENFSQILSSFRQFK